MRGSCKHYTGWCQPVLNLWLEDSLWIHIVLLHLRFAHEDTPVTLMFTNVWVLNLIRFRLQLDDIDEGPDAPFLDAVVKVRDVTCLRQSTTLSCNFMRSRFVKTSSFWA